MLNRLPRLLLIGLALSACTDLLPAPPRDTHTPDTRLPSDTLPPFDTASPDAATCSSDLDCASFARCCVDAACVSGQCAPRAVANCCSISGPCATQSALRSATCVTTCAVGGCVESLRLPPTAPCAPPLWTLAPTPEAFTVTERVSDRLTWHLSTRRTFQGLPTLHAGDRLCPTYSAAPRDPTCAPLASDAGPTTLSLDTATPIPLPVDTPTVASAWIWLDVPARQGLSTPLDRAELLVLGDRFQASLWSSARFPVPVRTWTPILIDLTPWAGQTVHFRLRFLTGDGRDNDFEGAYLADLQVRSPCPADRLPPTPTACTTARPTPIRSTLPFDDSLYVQGPPPGLEAAACLTCSDAAACPPTPCGPASCTAGRCTPPPTTDACCTSDPAPLLPDADPDLAFATWLRDGPWELLPSTSAAPSSLPPPPLPGPLLHFGATPTALALPGASARGTLWSAPVTIPTSPPDANFPPILSFSLFLSTEWDLLPDHANPAGIDRLDLVLALTNPTGSPALPITVWTSTLLGGTTADAWEPVRVDLTPWSGLEVRIGWRFDTVDTDLNDPGGVWLTTPTLYRHCSACAATTCPAP